MEFVKYTAWFLAPEEVALLEQELGGFELVTKIKFPHITHQYKPENPDKNLLGLKAKFQIIAYGNDGKNEGVKVELLEVDEKLPELQRKAYEEIAVPHITTSMAEEAKAKDTRYLTFNPCKTFNITATYGFFVNGKSIYN